MSDPSTETVAHRAETPVAVAADKKRFVPWATLTMLFAFALLALRGSGVPLWVSVPAVLVLAFLCALVVGMRRRGPLRCGWLDVAEDDPALPADVRAELARAAADFRALGLEPAGMARSNLPGGLPAVWIVAADDPRTGIRASARVVREREGRPARLGMVGFATGLKDGFLTTFWGEVPVAPSGDGVALLPTTRSAPRLYRVHLYRHAGAGTRVDGLVPAGTVAERALRNDERHEEWLRAHDWVRPRADGSPRFSTWAAVHMVLRFLPPGRWLLFFRHWIAERVLLARAGAWHGPAGVADPERPRPGHPEAPAAHQ
jgi:hypothetical protein